MALIGALHFQYNGQDLPAGASRIAVDFHQPETMFGNTGIITETWDVIGFVRGDTRDQLDTNMGTIEDAFRAVGGDLKLVDSVGTATKHILLNADTLNGVSPIRFAWINTPPVPGEYVHRRSFRMRATGLSLPSYYENSLVEWHESVRYIGTGGTVTKWRPSLFGVPIAQYVQVASTVMCIQRGTAVGFVDYPTPPDPLFPLYPQVLPSSPIEYVTPKILGNNPALYRVNWLWVMQGTSANITNTTVPVLP